MEVKWNVLGKFSHRAWFCFFLTRAKRQEQRIKTERGFINQTKVARGGQSSDIITLHCQPGQRPPLGVMLYVIVGTFKTESSWNGQWINPNNQPFVQRLFFYWIGNWKNETPVQKAGHIPGFTSDRILYDRGSCAPACHYLHSLLIAFGYKRLWKRQNMLGEVEPGAL